MAGISEHIHQSGHPFPLGLYIGFTRLHGVALLRGGTMFDSGQDHVAFRTGVARGCCRPWMPRAAASLGCFRRVGMNPCDPVRARMHGRLESVRWEVSQDLQAGGVCTDPAPIAYMAGISEHIHQSGHHFPLGLYTPKLANCF